MSPQHSPTAFYDAESAVYSDKRYPIKTATYVQYFFKRRLALALKVIVSRVSGRTGLKLLDVGCADGVVTRSVIERFPETFSTLVGTDVSLPMIEAAKRSTLDPRVSFFGKSDAPKERFDVVLGLGYLSPAIFDGEIRFVLDRLAPDGLYICTLASKGSLHARFKLKGEPYLADYRSYDEYRSMLSKHFDIISETSYGFFIPKLWSMPAIGRALQPLFDAIFRHIAPGAFHETMYALKLKQQ